MLLLLHGSSHFSWSYFLITTGCSAYTQRVEPLLQLLPIRYPDILHLCGLAQEFLAFALLADEPVAGMAVADPGTLHVAGGGQFDQLAALAGTEIPDRFNILLLSQNLNQVVSGTGD